MLQAFNTFSQWFILSFALNIYFREVFTWVIARGCSDPFSQRDWISYSSVFLTLNCRLSPQWRPHINKYYLYIRTPPEAGLQWMQFCSPPADDQFSVFFPSGTFCLGSPWISLSFHHSLMSSCSCQHLLTASNSLQHTGSWDPCDELQSAVCRGGLTLSQANQGKHPLPRGRASTDRLSPSYPVITLPLPLCCKLLHLNPVSRGADTLVITFQSV